MTMRLDTYVNVVLPLLVVGMAFGMYGWFKWVHAADTGDGKSTDRRIKLSLAFWLVILAGLLIRNYLNLPENPS